MPAPLRYFAFDTETSGFEPSDGAELLSYAYITLDENLEEVSRQQRFFFAAKPVPEAAARVNGYTEEKWASLGALPPDQIRATIATDLRRDVPVKLMPLGHNVPFDLRFFRANADAPTLSRALDYHAVDTMSLAIAIDQARGQKGSYKLTALSERYGIDLGDKAHDSLADILATVELYRRLVAVIRGDNELPKAPSGSGHSFLEKVGEEIRFRFGKHKGRTLADVRATNPGYIPWVLGNVTSNLSDADRKVLTGT